MKKDKILKEHFSVAYCVNDKVSSEDYYLVEKRKEAFVASDRQSAVASKIKGQSDSSSFSLIFRQEVNGFYNNNLNNTVYFVLDMSNKKVRFNTYPYYEVHSDGFDCRAANEYLCKVLTQMTDITVYIVPGFDGSLQYAIMHKSDVPLNIFRHLCVKIMYSEDHYFEEADNGFQELKFPNSNGGGYGSFFYADKEYTEKYLSTEEA